MPKSAGGCGVVVRIGQVTPNKEAIVKLTVPVPNGQQEEVAAVLDTGYTEYLTLPPTVITALGLWYRYSLPMYLADGNPIWAGKI